jgi:hypothetical protein
MITIRYTLCDPMHYSIYRRLWYRTVFLFSRGKRKSGMFSSSVCILESNDRPWTPFLFRRLDFVISIAEDKNVEVQLTEGYAGEILLHRGFTWEDLLSLPVANRKLYYDDRPGVVKQTDTRFK